jgi:LysM repeat protein
MSAGILSIPAGAQQESPADMQSIVVKPGDTLWSVAQRYLKDPTKWDEILRYNRLPSSDPTVALPGMSLRLPIRSVREEFQAAQVISTINRVLHRSRDGGPWTEAAVDMEVFRNDTIKTLADSDAVIRFLDNDLLQITPNSMAIVMPVTKDYHIELKHGGVVAGNKRIRVGAAVVSPANPNTVYTASVNDDQSTVVRVFRGEASVAAAGRTVKVATGQATEVKLGLAPSLPFAIPDISSFQSMVSGFEGRLLSIKKRFARMPAPLHAEAPRPMQAPQTDDLMREAAAIKAMEAVMGYRVECSRTQDFQPPVTQKYFDVSAPMRPEDFDLPQGRYWCRMAPVDLLGAVGKFKEPKVYSLGRLR